MSGSGPRSCENRFGELLLEPEERRQSAERLGVNVGAKEIVEIGTAEATAAARREDLFERTLRIERRRDVRAGASMPTLGPIMGTSGSTLAASAGIS